MSHFSLASKTKTNIFSTWSHKRDGEQDLEQESLKFETQTKTKIDIEIEFELTLTLFVQEYAE